MRINKDYLQLHFIVFLGSFIPTVAIWISLPSLEIVLLRTLAAIILLGLIIYFRKFNIRLKPHQLIPLLSSGVLTSIYWTLLIFSAKVANASVSLVGVATSPLWVSFIAPLITRQKKIDVHQIIIGINAAFGVYMIFTSGFEYSWGMSVAIIAAFVGALLTVISSKLAQIHNHYVITFYQMVGAWAGTVIILFFTSSIFIHRKIQLNPTWVDLLLILALAFVFSVYAYSVFIKIMKNLSPFTVSLATNLTPVYGILVALMFSSKSETMDIYFYAGATILIASLMAIPLSNYLFGPGKSKG
ncbi:DMT family transporter [Rapidithrix thailandica]|uniref:DMT family transporter n=1 Tax=Rapidithrix thailandica TaxID=413964 RepID=A0AAW9RZI3_9BACT